MKNLLWLFLFNFYIVLNSVGEKDESVQEREYAEILEKLRLYKLYKLEKLRLYKLCKIINLKLYEEKLEKYEKDIKKYFSNPKKSDVFLLNKYGFDIEDGEFIFEAKVARYLSKHMNMLEVESNLTEKKALDDLEKLKYFKIYDIYELNEIKGMFSYRNIERKKFFDQKDIKSDEYLENLKKEFIYLVKLLKTIENAINDDKIFNSIADENIRKHAKEFRLKSILKILREESENIKKYKEKFEKSNSLELKELKKAGGYEAIEKRYVEMEEELKKTSSDLKEIKKLILHEEEALKNKLIQELNELRKKLYSQEYKVSEDVKNGNELMSKMMEKNRELGKIKQKMPEKIIDLSKQKNDLEKKIGILISDFDFISELIVEEEKKVVEILGKESAEESEVEKQIKEKESKLQKARDDLKKEREKGKDGSQHLIRTIIYRVELLNNEIAELENSLKNTEVEKEKLEYNNIRIRQKKVAQLKSKINSFYKNHDRFENVLIFLESAEFSEDMNFFESAFDDIFELANGELEEFNKINDFDLFHSDNVEWFLKNGKYIKILVQFCVNLVIKAQTPYDELYYISKKKDESEKFAKAEKFLCEMKEKYSEKHYSEFDELINDAKKEVFDLEKVEALIKKANADFDQIASDFTKRILEVCPKFILKSRFSYEINKRFSENKEFKKIDSSLFSDKVRERIIDKKNGEIRFSEEFNKEFFEFLNKTANDFFEFAKKDLEDFNKDGFDLFSDESLISLYENETLKAVVQFNEALFIISIEASDSYAKQEFKKIFDEFEGKVLKICPKFNLASEISYFDLIKRKDNIFKKDNIITYLENALEVQEINEDAISKTLKDRLNMLKIEKRDLGTFLVYNPDIIGKNKYKINFQTFKKDEKFYDQGSVSNKTLEVEESKKIEDAKFFVYFNCKIFGNEDSSFVFFVNLPISNDLGQTKYGIKYSKDFNFCKVHFGGVKSSNNFKILIGFEKEVPKLKDIKAVFNFEFNSTYSVSLLIKADLNEFVQLGIGANIK